MFSKTDHKVVAVFRESSRIFTLPNATEDVETITCGRSAAMSEIEVSQRDEEETHNSKESVVKTLS